MPWSVWSDWLARAAARCWMDPAPRGSPSPALCQRPGFDCGGAKWFRPSPYPQVDQIPSMLPFNHRQEQAVSNGERPGLTEIRVVGSDESPYAPGVSPRSQVG